MERIERMARIHEILARGGAVSVSREDQSELAGVYGDRLVEINEEGFRKAPSTVVELLPLPGPFIVPVVSPDDSTIIGLYTFSSMAEAEAFVAGAEGIELLNESAMVTNIQQLPKVATAAEALATFREDWGME